jgi:hypothetical protein
MQPQHLQHGALLKQNAMFYPQVAYPMMANTMPSERTHGVFSSYPARLKHSDDNALLLPESYVNNKRTRFTESEDEFEASEEEDQDDDDASRATAKPSEKLKSPPKQLLPKIIRKKNHLDYQLTDLHLLARMEEILVPIRLDIDVDSIKLRDRFLWNMNGKKIVVYLSIHLTRQG